MKNKRNTNKVVIPCPECSKAYIKQYISTHIKNKHKNTIYSKIIKRGMRYTLINNKNIFKTNKQIYCFICKRFLKNNSYYMHIKTNIHKFLSKIKNDENNKESNSYSPLKLKNNELCENNNNVNDHKNINKDNYNETSMPEELKSKISEKIFVDLNNNKQKENNFYHNNKTKEAGNKNITKSVTPYEFSYTSDYFDESSSVITLSMWNLENNIKRMKIRKEVFEDIDKVIFRIKSKNLKKKKSEK